MLCPLSAARECNLHRAGEKQLTLGEYTMKRLLTTTALVAMVSGSAFAASDATMNTNFAMENGQPVFSDMMKKQAEIDQNGFVKANTDQILASNLLGANIYNSVTEEGEVIGDINDMLVSSDGKLEGVVVGVGGFLGMGEKDVVIAIDRLAFKTGVDGERWIVSEMSREALEGAEPFKPEAMTQESAATETEALDETTTASTNDAAMFKPLIEASPLRAENLIGMDVHGANDNDIGEVGDVIVGKDGAVEALIIDVGGFLGMGEKEVAVGLDNLMISQADGTWDWSVIKTQFTEAELEKQPAYSKDSYSELGTEGLLKSRTMQN